MPHHPMTTLVCLSFLGGSASGWHRMFDRLPAGFDPMPVDLPGFGSAAAIPGYGVGAMADHVAAAVRARAPARWVLAGHSMGAKVAAVLARRAQDGEAGLDGLAGLVTLAGSPPAPEPMQESKRAEMLGWFSGSPTRNQRQARQYIRGNLGLALARPHRERLVRNMLPARVAAWTAWLRDGSREDWRDRIGLLDLPALVLSGTADADLGPAAQARHMLPHLANAEFVPLPGAGHLLPMECPGAVARLIAERFAPTAAIPEAYLALINSDRVSTGTRAALLERAAAPSAPSPSMLSAAERGSLRALVARVIPQSGPGRIDLAGPLARQLSGPGDGWRNAALPADAAAWRTGLRTLDKLAKGFAGQSPEAQDKLLQRIAAGRTGGSGPGQMDAAQMQAWFEDVRAEATRAYVAHPATFARLGYSGIGYGGDGPGKPGFTEISIGQREAWEPV
ncbi:MAG: alpha/beta fold hydrolase [Janthinobacterium lividum]